MANKNVRPGLLQRELQQRGGFSSPAEEAFLNLQRTTGILMQSFAQILKEAGGPDLSTAQYNVLRILRGSHPDALSCGEIGQRMVTADPDVTRLVDRLVRRDLAARSRDAADRRVVKVVITAAGLQLLTRLDGVVAAWLEGHLGHLEVSRLERLSRLLEQARKGATGNAGEAAKG